MSHKEEDPDDIEAETMEDFSEQRGHTPALPSAKTETLMEKWDEAKEREHLPTIPGTATLDTVKGDAYLWDSECNKGLKFEGELMSRVDHKAVKRND